MDQSQRSDTPPHVLPALVVDIDIYTDDRLLADPHLGWRSFHATAPDIFYTPRNGGHWVITRYDLMYDVLRDHEHFSNRELHIPKANSEHLFIPLSLDPPEHAPYRLALMRHFDRRVIASMEDTLRGWASRLIDRVADKGGCDFVESLGAGFPVSVFMELMGMPLERFDEFRSIVLEYFSNIPPERRNVLQDRIVEIMTALFESRRRERRDDLASKLLDEKVNGRPLTEHELQSIGFLLFLAGLDTVANAITFSFRHLASDPALQKQLREHPERIVDFVEESLRRYAVVNQTRIVKRDIDIGDAHFRVGDMVLCPLTMAGLDDRKNPTPETFDIDRPNRQHITFSTGAHNCAGTALARAEMRIFTEEWLKRVPECSIAPGAALQWRAGTVMALGNLPLTWPVQVTQRA